MVATQAQVMADAGVATREAADEVVERQGAGRPEAARLGVEPMAEERVVAPLARATAGMRAEQWAEATAGAAEAVRVAATAAHVAGVLAAVLAVAMAAATAARRAAATAAVAAPVVAVLAVMWVVATAAD